MGSDTQHIIEKEFPLPFSKETCIASLAKITQKGIAGEPDFYISKYRMNKQSNPALNVILIEFGIKLITATLDISLTAKDENNSLMKIRGVSYSAFLTEGMMQFVNTFVAICEGKTYNEASAAVKESGGGTGATGGSSGCILIALALFVPTAVLAALYMF